MSRPLTYVVRVVIRSRIIDIITELTSSPLKVVAWMLMACMRYMAGEERYSRAVKIATRITCR